MTFSGICGENRLKVSFGIHLTLPVMKATFMAQLYGKNKRLLLASTHIKDRPKLLHYLINILILKWHVEIGVQPTQFIFERMRDIRTKINNGNDKESQKKLQQVYFLKRDFLRNDLQFSVFNLQVFIKKYLTYAIYQNQPFLKSNSCKNNLWFWS